MKIINITRAFRIYDTKNKRYIDKYGWDDEDHPLLLSPCGTLVQPDTYPDGGATIVTPVEQEHWEFEPCVGFYDMEGVPVYAGDIVSGCVYRNDDELHRDFIVFYENYAWWGKEITGRVFPIGEIQDARVVGNIHESEVNK